MHIGIDFDNTIVSYETAIPFLASRLLKLPAFLPLTKIHIRDYLRSNDREAEWTLFQGELYGPGMEYARPYQGAIAAMNELKAQGHTLSIVSHRTKQPYLGPAYDLHSFAKDWIAKHLNPSSLFLEEDAYSDVYFLDTLALKLSNIEYLGCDVFVDDLPEVLTSLVRPSSVQKILFDPSFCSGSRNSCFSAVIHAWSDLPDVMKVMTDTADGNQNLRTVVEK